MALPGQGEPGQRDLRERWICGSSRRMTCGANGCRLSHRGQRFSPQRSSKRFPVFFLLSKTLGVLLLPTNFLIVVGLAGLALLATRFVSLGRKLLAASLVLLAFCGFSPLG